jgi:hypothetical protein
MDASGRIAHHDPLHAKPFDGLGVKDVLSPYIVAFFVEGHLRENTLCPGT